MKKNTFAKWMLAATVMCGAFGCQKEKAPEAPEASAPVEKSCCPCTNGCSSQVTPATVEAVTALNDVEQTEQISTYVIEMEEPEMIAVVPETGSAPAEEPLAVEISHDIEAKATTQAEAPIETSSAETTEDFPVEAN